MSSRRKIGRNGSRKVTTGRVRGLATYHHGGEGTIRFTLKELLAGEGSTGTIRREIHHGLVHLTRVTIDGHRRSHFGWN